MCDHIRQYTSGNHSFQFPFSLQISLLLCHHGLWYIGYDETDGCSQGELSQKKSDIFNVFNLPHSRFKPLIKTAKEISFLYSRFFSACSMEYSQQSSTLLEKGASTEISSKFLDSSKCHYEGLLISLWYLRAVLRSQFRSISKDLIKKHLDILDFFEYYLYFSLAWLQRSSEALLLMVQPFLIGHDGCNPYEVDMVNLKKLIPKVAQLLSQNSFITCTENLEVSKSAENKLDADIKCSVPDDERWKILGTCLWQHMSRFMISNLNLVLAKLEDGNVSASFHRYRESTHINMDSDSISLPEQILLVTFSLCDLLTTTVTHISSYHVKQLAEFLWKKLENDSNVATLEWLKQTSQSESNQNKKSLDILELVNRQDNNRVHQLLWDCCADPKLICDCFAQEKLNWSKDFDHKPSKGWNDLYNKTDESHDDERKLSTRDANHEVASPVKGMLISGHASAKSNQKDIICMSSTVFQSPREIYRRNGELLEVIISSI